MNASEALARLRALGVPVIRTADAAAALEQSTSAASRTLTRLAGAGLVVRVRHGVYWVEGAVDPYRLPEHLTSPWPSYVSLLSALWVRGLVEQIPDLVYAASLARSQRIRTSMGVVSIHHLAPEVYGGFEETPSGVKLATAEKALFDLAYLSGGRSRRFASLPELELPARFRRAELHRWVARISSPRGRTLTAARLERVLARAR